MRNTSGMLVTAIAASLPWSTSATAILVGLWLVSLLATLRPEDVYHEMRTPAAALPIALWVIALLGMFWADVSWAERLNGLKPFHKLLVLPLLFAQFRQTPNVKPVFGAFLVASVLLALVSWALVLLPGISWRGENYIGVPVKDYISQSGVFTLCIFGLLWIATQRQEKSGRRWLVLALAALFLSNIVYVATSRTSLVVVVGLALLFSIRRFGWRGFLAL
ncbi:MAG: ligase, partial [Proteobacteria bacterium]|nr:ligase [Pseudomonadota bacterium]